MVMSPTRPAGSERPRLTVGIVGHRWNKLPEASRGAVWAQLAETFAALDREAGGAATLVSGMAEGADQMAVHAALAHWRVEALLPMPLAAFERDFLPDRAGGGIDRRDELRAAMARADAVTELHGGPDAYAAQGRALVERCDALVAVWDGRSAAGKGGTAEVVALARERARTVRVIEAGAAPVAG